MSSVETFRARVRELWNLRYSDSRQLGVLGAELISSGSVHKQEHPSTSSGTGPSTGVRRAHPVSSGSERENTRAYGKLFVAISNFFNSKDEHVLEYLLDSYASFAKLNDADGLGKACAFLASVYDNYGEYETALRYAQEGLRHAETTKDEELEADVHANAGLIYTRISDLEHAEQSFLKSLTIRERMGNHRAVASSLNLLGRTYSLANKFEQALDYYNRSLTLRIEQQDKGGIPWTYIGMASVFERMQDFASALDYYGKSAAQSKENKDVRANLYCLLGSGKIRLNYNEPELAKLELQEGLQIAESIKSKPLMYDFHQALSKAYELLVDYQQSLNHLRLFQELKEEVLSTETTNKMKHQQMSFDIERSRQEAEIFRLRNVELKEAYDKIEEKNKAITDSINYALRIQQAILPSKAVMAQGLPEHFVLYLPKDIVSGDFYWFGEQEGFSIVAAVDCTGHGVPGAFMSMVGSSLLNQIVLEKNILAPDAILSALHLGVTHALQQHGTATAFGEKTRDGMDIALCVLQKSANGYRLAYAGANRPLYHIRQSLLNETKATKLSIGGADEGEARAYTAHNIQLETGDAFYIFSDGYADQFSASDQKMMTRRFKELLLEVQGHSMVEQEQRLRTFFLEWRGEAEQTDDVLVIGVRV